MRISVIVIILIISSIMGGIIYPNMHTAENAISTKNDVYHFYPDKLKYIFKIDGNSQLIQFLHIHHASGNGTKANPYRIFNIQINLKDNVEGGLYIYNTSLYILFENLKIYNSFKNEKIGIGVVNSTHIIFENCSIYNNFSTLGLMGFYILNSSKIIIKNFIFKDLSSKNSGIWALNSNQITVENATIWNSNDFSIFLRYCDGVWLYNIITIRGFFMIYNTNNLTVSHSTFYTHNTGIILVFSVNSIIKDNKFIENYEGLWTIESENNVISHNVFMYDIEGINMGGINCPTHGNIIKDNLFAYNQKYGVYLDVDGSNWIYGNIFLNSSGHDNGYLKEPPYWNYTYTTHSFWNNSIEGNYWSNFTINPVPILGHAHTYDYHPLKIKPFSYTLIPSSPQNLTFKKSKNYIILHWKPPKYLSTQVTEYKIYKNGELVGIAAPDENSYKIPIQNNKVSIYYITAVDKNGNESMISNEIIIPNNSSNTNYLLWIIIPSLVAILIIISILIVRKNKFKY